MKSGKYNIKDKTNHTLSFMAGAASQAGDADSSLAPGLTSGLQGSVDCWCHSDSASVLLYFYIYRATLISHFPRIIFDFAFHENCTNALLLVYL